MAPPDASGGFVMRCEEDPGYSGREGRRWLVARFLPCSLFALKISSATSSVGRTLVVPTPYAIKMALVDVAFRIGVREDVCALFLKELIGVAVRIAPPEHAVVSHTFLKVRQEPKNPNPDQPYISSVAYREFVFHRGLWRWAFDLEGQHSSLNSRLMSYLPYVRYVGKRGSFVQFLDIDWTDELDAGFTQPLDDGEALRMPSGPAHVVPLDDFGPQADLETLSTYSPKRAVAGRHRVFVNTLVPLGVVNTGPGFTEYRGAESDD